MTDVLDVARAAGLGEFGLLVALEVLLGSPPQAATVVTASADSAARTVRVC
ncbi:hypothetical protein GCM10027269_71100 [Kribbella endophytica]